MNDQRRKLYICFFKDLVVCGALEPQSANQKLFLTQSELWSDTKVYLEILKKRRRQRDKETVAIADE